MSAEHFVRMLEEMIDLKVQQHTELRLKTSPEVAKILQDKRQTDQLRFEQLRAELIRLLKG